MINDKLKLIEKSSFYNKLDHEYIFGIYYENNLVGDLEYRPIKNRENYYYGQIGYSIYSKYRGNKLSYYACLKVFEIAKKEHGLKELYITCSPDNYASLHILNKLKGELIETVNVPKDHQLYLRNEKIKCIYRFIL